RPFGCRAGGHVSAVAIPDFDQRGNLPPGRHRASAAEIRDSLVDAFPTSRTRSGIFAYWSHHRDALSELVPVHFQWIGGSFTSDKPDPADADIVSVIDGSAFDSLAPHQQLL